MQLLETEPVTAREVDEWQVCLEYLASSGEVEIDEAAGSQQAELPAQPSEAELLAMDPGGDTTLLGPPSVVTTEPIARLPSFGQPTTLTTRSGNTCYYSPSNLRTPGAARNLDQSSWRSHPTDNTQYSFGAKRVNAVINNQTESLRISKVGYFVNIGSTRLLGVTVIQPWSWYGRLVANAGIDPTGTIIRRLPGGGTIVIPGTGSVTIARALYTVGFRRNGGALLANGCASGSDRR